MRHADRNTPLDTSELPQDVRAIIRASVHNRRIFRDADPEESDLVTKSLRYANIDRPRPDFRNFDELAAEYSEDEAQRLRKELQILDYEDTALRFQLESWLKIQDKYTHVLWKDSDQGVMINAPTGFGKTGAFMGEIFKQIIDGNPDSAIFVYPSRALLEDQLSRVLEIIHHVKSDLEWDTIPSVGFWYGNQPRQKDSVTNTSGRTAIVDDTEPGLALNVGSYWEDVDDTNLYVENTYSDNYEVYTADGNVTFKDSEFVLHKNGVREVEPEIILTTLESLESIALKPHYDLVENANFFVFDEVHQYSGLRGAHASKVIENVKYTRDDPALFIGASATVDEPGMFAQKLFGFEEDQLAVLDEFEEDINKSNNDKQHYYFLLTPEEGPGSASQYIQQSMMIGHSLLESDTDRSKFLTFIDSISQIHRLETQFIDADQTRKLWKEHLLDGPGDWQQLATETGHTFINEPIRSPVPIYSDSKAGIDDINDADIIHSSSFLEIGVDIGDLHYIGQYRPPRNISSFRQRAGRAARDSGSDAHIFVFLSNYAGDTNFYYRADRFLEKEVMTPISTDNNVVQWIHDHFRTYYDELEQLKARYPSDWPSKQNERIFLEELFADELNYDRFYDFLTDIDLQELIEKRTTSTHLLDDGVNDTLVAINDREEEIEEELENLGKFLTQESGEILLHDDVVNEFIDSIVSDARALIVEFATTLDEADPNREYDAELHDEIESLLDELDEIDSYPIATKIDRLSNQIVGGLFGIYGQSLSVGSKAGMRDAIPNNDRIAELEQAIDDLRQAYEERSLEKQSQQRKKIYYLRKALSEISEYNDVRELGNVEISFAHGSLYAIKHLFRAAYYYNKCLQVHDDEPGIRVGEHYFNTDEEFWYVPPNYFDDAGRYFSLSRGDKPEQQDQNEEDISIEKLLTQYLPYRTKFSDDDGTVQVFNPNIVETDGGREFDFGEINGRIHKGIKIPDRIAIESIPDFSGGEGRGVHAYDPDTLELLSQEDLATRRREPKYGKFYPTPQIETSVEVNSLDDDIGQLQLISADAKAWLEAINLEITPYERDGNTVYSDSEAELFNRRIERQDTKLGYVLETRAVSWDLTDYLDSINEDLVELVGERYKDYSIISAEQIALTTAAHFLTILVSDVSGVTPDMLLYGIDDEEGSVHVFEQTEGGQGIVDLFFDQIQRNPATVLDSVYRLLHNSQVLNERFWSNSGDVEPPVWKQIHTGISTEKLLEGDKETRRNQLGFIQTIAEGELGISYEPSLERITEETATTIERIEHLHENFDIPKEELYRLKSHLATDRIKGKEEVPEATIQEFPDIFNAASRDTIEDLLLSPDIDSCRANLRLNHSISDVDQENALSYRFLEHLEDQVIDRVPKEQQDTLIEQGQYWAWIDGDELVYLRW